MKLTSLTVFVLLATIFTGCKQDFDITADYKEIPVVYGLLNQQDNVHYIRIQKGFLIDGNALVAAGVADSVYYPDVLTVKLNPYYNGSPNGAAFTLTRVDGNTQTPPVTKDFGTFANSPNVLYRFTGTLDPTKSYRLEVTNTTNGNFIKTKKNEDGLEITLVKDFQISSPHTADKIKLQNTTPSKVVWSAAENAGIYDLTVRLYYKEYATANNFLLRDTFIDILFFKSIAYDYNASGSLPPFEITADNVLTFLKNHLTATNDVYREFNVAKGMDFKLAAGGTELTKFMNSQQAQGGLASNEALPPYTNIDGGVGLLSSRYFKEVDGVLFSNNALDTLACSELSRNLRFKNHNGVVCP